MRFSYVWLMTDAKGVTQKVFDNPGTAMDMYPGYEFRSVDESTYISSTRSSSTRSSSTEVHMVLRRVPVIHTGTLVQARAIKKRRKKQHS